VQRAFRGHLGRKVAKLRVMQRVEHDSANALVNSCALQISRVWRGHRGRMVSKYLRKEMADFLLALREEEARDEEEEYAAMQSLLRWK